LKPEIFRAYDIRGQAGSDLNGDTAYAVGRGLGSQARRRGTTALAVGRDNRLSSPGLAAGVAAGIRASGVDVYDLGVVITPMFYYALHTLPVGGGAMVTGSHNPADENGFKLALGRSTIYGEEIQELYRIVAAGDFTAGRGASIRTDIAGPYLAMLRERLGEAGAGLSVAVDCGNGTASLFAREFLKACGARLIPLYCDSDGRFPNHHPDPVVPANLRDLRAAVREKGADLGVAYDGDADRLGVVDDTGRIVYGDLLMVLFWRDLLPRYPGAEAIVEVKCSQALVDEVTRLGGRPFFHRTGHSLIKATMRRTGAVFTGEMSGHLFFADAYFGYDDAFYATGRLLDLLRRAGQRLSGLLADVPVYYATGETRIPCADDKKFAVVGQLTGRFKERFPVIDVDGARVLFPRGWALVRASNTQPVLVARCEAKDPDALASIREAVAGELARLGVPEFRWEEG